MKIPLSWLREFIETEASVSQIEEALTLAGLEVEKIQPTTFNFSGVVTAQVVKISPHPQAEKLSIATVSDGLQEFQVVCGAANCREGLITAFAKVGATITPAGLQTHKIKKAKLRGIESYGMLASEKELGLSNKDEGIMELPEQTPIGTNLDALLGDVLFDISLTPNLGHAMSIYGIARELYSQLPKAKLIHPSIPHLQSKQTGNPPLQVLVNSADCYAYHCVLLKNVSVGPSPQWLQKRLESCGIRPINNIVDTTNYIMLKLGQPLHAYDYDKIHGQEIHIKQCDQETSLETLDDQRRTVSKECLLVCDSSQTLAIAGIMGCSNSSISEQTQNVLLEAAHFNPVAIRRASKNLHLRSESSARFERGIDPSMPQKAMASAAYLIETLAGGTVGGHPIQQTSRDFPVRKLICRSERVSKILGIKLSLAEMEEIFQKLQMDVENFAEYLEVAIPSFRNDIQSEIDLIEEIARVHGYNHIPKRSPHFQLGKAKHHPLFAFERRLRQTLLEEGLQEFITCDLISHAQSKQIEQAFRHIQPISVMHPSSVEQSILRMSMLPSMLRSVQVNFEQQVHDIQSFEIGRIHYQIEKAFQEKESLGILICGKFPFEHFDKTQEEEVDFFSLKGILENIFEKLHIQNITFNECENPLFHPKRQAQILFEDQQLGLLGELHPNGIAHLGAKKRIYFAELDVSALHNLSPKITKMHPLPIYPGSQRDWTVTLKSTTPIATVTKAAKEFPSAILQSCKLLYLYDSQKLGPDKKNATFRFIYRSEKKTLHQESIDQEHEKILRHIHRRLEDLIISD